MRVHDQIIRTAYGVTLGAAGTAGSQVFGVDVSDITNGIVALCAMLSTLIMYLAYRRKK